MGDPDIDDRQEISDRDIMIDVTAHVMHIARMQSWSHKIGLSTVKQALNGRSCHSHTLNSLAVSLNSSGTVKHLLLNNPSVEM